MTVRVPDYFCKFRCIQGECQDSCCVGWEIATDDEAKEKYAAVSGEIGREIAEKTQHGYFPLDENGRCAFLTGDGLCRIITSLGESFLCDICREHPRYYGVGADGIEGGLGISCEAAARIILATGGNVAFTYTDRYVKYFSEDGFAELSDIIREHIYSKIREYDALTLIAYLTDLAPIADGIAFDTVAGLSVGGIPEIEIVTVQEKISDMLSRFLDMLSECEALGGEWQDVIKRARGMRNVTPLPYEKEIKSLLFYFTHRYVRECVEDLSIGQRILLAVLSSLSVIAISTVMDCEEKTVRAAVLFSKNIEYSTDNIDALLEQLSDFL